MEYLPLRKMGQWNPYPKQLENTTGQIKTFILLNTTQVTYARALRKV